MVGAKGRGQCHSKMGLLEQGKNWREISRGRAIMEGIVEDVQINS